MILHEILGSEDHPTYTALAAENLLRQYDFLNSIVVAAINAKSGRTRFQCRETIESSALTFLSARDGKRPFLSR